MFGLEFQRAAALSLLVLPLVLWWLARRPRPPQERATGTLEIWREVLERAIATPTTRGRGVPPGLYCLLLGLVLGTLALAGPRSGRSVAPEWRVVLDTRTGMYLPWRGEGAPETTRRRLDVALDVAREWIEGPALWMRFDGERWEHASGVAPPAAWLRDSNRTTDSMPWSEVDRADTLWITDGAPQSHEASWIASGGDRVDGVVGRRNGRIASMRDGERIELGAPDRVRLALDARLPEALRGLCESWARERGAELVDVDADADATVRVTAPRSGERVVPGDGWSLTGRAAEEPVGRALWRDSAGDVALSAAPGTLRLALHEPLELEGDRRAFALDWLEALEASVLEPDGTVPLAARRSVGSGGRFRGAGPGPPLRTSPGVLVSWLALGAALLVGLGLRAGALRL